MSFECFLWVFGISPTIGPLLQIYVFQLKDNDLVGASFIDSQVYIHQMNTIKNLVLIADIHMSISVLRYQSEHRVLSMVSRVSLHSSFNHWIALWLERLAEDREIIGSSPSSEGAALE